MEEKNYMTVYNGIRSLVPQEILSTDEVFAKIFRFITTNINMFNRLSAKTNIRPIPAQKDAIIKECKENKQFAEEFQNTFNEYINTDGDLMIVMDETGNDIFFMKGSYEYFDDKNIGYARNLSDLNFFYQFSQDLNNYTDVFCNKIEFNLSKIVRK